MAAALRLLSKERVGPNIRYLVLFYPVMDANLDHGSYRKFADGRWTTKTAMDWLWVQV